MTIHWAKPSTRPDRVTITIVVAGITLFSGELAVLPGDSNGDGKVNSVDVNAVLDEWLRGRADYSIYGDINGDGVVNQADYNLVVAAQRTSLPPGPPLVQALVNGNGGVAQAEVATNLAGTIEQQEKKVSGTFITLILTFHNRPDRPRSSDSIRSQDS